MLFIYESLVGIENALFRFYPVLASIFGPQGLDFGTDLGENTTKIDHETGFENLSCFDTCFRRFLTIFDPKMGGFFVARAVLLAPKLHSGPHFGPVGVIL